MREILASQGVRVIVGKIVVGVKKIDVGVKKIGVFVGTGEINGVAEGNAVGNGVWLGAAVGVMPGVGAVGTGVGEPEPGGSGVGGGVPLVGVGGKGIEVGVGPDGVAVDIGGEVAMTVTAGFVTLFESFPQAAARSTANKSAGEATLRSTFDSNAVPGPIRSLETSDVDRSKSPTATESSQRDPTSRGRVCWEVEVRRARPSRAPREGRPKAREPIDQCDLSVASSGHR